MSRRHNTRVYIAGPYTTPDPVENTHNAVQVWHVLHDEGFAPYCPHLSLHLHMMRPLPYDQWLEHDMVWLDVCDAVLRLPGESPGADKEVQYAKSHGIPVFETIEELIQWQEEIEAEVKERMGA